MTVVIDWGLAKRIGEPSVDDEVVAGGPDPASPVGGAARARSRPVIDDDADALRSAQGARDAALSSDMTHAGTVLGTPAFMAPEQAEGKAVDQRADVYALGAILYYVLSGVLPYDGVRAKSSLEAVLAGPPPPLAERAPRTPRDLLGIVAKAMARDPDARYPTARELADDLSRFLTGRLVEAHRYTALERTVRLVRRHRSAVVVGASLLAVLAGVSIYSVLRIVRERDVAEAERRRAEARAQSAERIIDFLRGDLYGRLEPIGRIDTLEDVGAKIDEYYEALARVTPLTAEERERQASALRVRGEAKLGGGDLEAAAAAYRKALAILEALAAQAPGDARRQGRLAMALDDVGRVTKARGDLDGALAAFRRARDILRALIASHPDDGPSQRTWRQALVGTLNDVADVEDERSDGKAALATVREALSLARELHELAPDDVELAVLLADVHGAHGELLRDAKDLTGALAELEAARTLRVTLLERHPENWQLRRKVGTTHVRIGDLRRDQRDHAAALEAYRVALEHARQCAARDPLNAEWLRDVAVALGRIGTVQRNQGDLKAALETYLERRSIVARVAALDPTRAGRRHDLAIAHDDAGDVMRALDDVRGAVAEYQLALAIREELVRRDDDNVVWQYGLANTHEDLAIARLKLGELDAALASAREQERIGERLASIDPKPRHLIVAEAAAEHIGDALERKGDLEGAFAAWRRSLEMAERRLKRWPDDVEARAGVGASHALLVEKLSAHGRTKEAIPHRARAIEMFEPLQAAGKLSPEETQAYERLLEERDRER
jgi:tetratricopeptide (TPR) repeat protein